MAANIVSPQGQFEDVSSEIEAEYDIVEHEQAHAAVMAKTNRGMSLLEEEGENRWNQTEPQQGLCEPFLDKFSGMINHKNLQSILQEQSHM